MRYFMFIKHSENYRNQEMPPALMSAMGEFVQEGFGKGWLVDTAGLMPSARGKRIELRGGKVKVVDGPFTESKEVIGGYAIVQADSDEKAMVHATQFVELHRVHWPGFDCECEIRPMEAMG